MKRLTRNTSTKQSLLLLTFSTSILLFCYVEISISADWKFFSASSDNVEHFYDHESLKKDKNGNFRVWAKGLKSEKIDKIFDGLSNKELIQNSALKLVSGYEPPYYTFYKNNPDVDKPTIIAMEEISNLNLVEEEYKILYDAYCPDKSFRVLSGKHYDENGKTLIISERKKKDYVDPDSHYNSLFNLICNK